MASRIGALPDFTDDGKRSSRLVEPGNMSQFAAALVEFIENPEKCRQFGEAGYDSVRDRFTWDAVGLPLRDEIKAMLHTPQPAQP